MIFIGIDPGLTGAIAAVKEDGSFHSIYDMPTISKGSGSVKNEVDPYGLRDLLQDVTLGEFKVVVYLERVNAMPKQGSASTFSLGDSFGTIRGVLGGMTLPVEYVTPAVWKKHHGLSSDKEMSRALATRKFPEAQLRLKKHADRAEALLIAEYGRQTYK